MLPSGKKLETRELASLSIAVLSLAAAAAYWLVWGDAAYYRYNLRPQALYQFVATPLMVASISFFISSRFISINLAKKALINIKTICLALGIAYALCITVVFTISEPMSYELNLVIMFLLEAFSPYFPIIIGLTLGTKTPSE